MNEQKNDELEDDFCIGCGGPLKVDEHDDNENEFYCKDCQKYYGDEDE